MSEKINTFNTDTVYHITDLAHLGSIEERGLVPGSREVGGMRSLVDEIVDDFRPRELIGRGITRTEGVYAHPLLEKLHKGSLSGKEQDSPIILSVEVDPDMAMVLDAKELDAVAEGLRRRDGYIPREAIKRYWATAVTLSDYRRLYDQSTGARLDNPPNNSRPSFYSMPEVLIPTPVGPEKVSWVASILGKKAVALAK
jgi:hypothetical protein